MLWEKDTKRRDIRAGESYKGTNVTTQPDNAGNGEKTIVSRKRWHRRQHMVNRNMNLCQVWAAITCQASSQAARTLFRAAIRFLSLVSTAGMVEFWMTEGRAWGSYLIMRKNGDCEVTECGRWLWVNLA